MDSPSGAEWKWVIETVRPVRLNILIVTGEGKGRMKAMLVWFRQGLG